MPPPPSTGIEAVLFDFGGVILTSPFDAFAAYETEVGLPPGTVRRINSTNPDDNAWARFERRQVDAGEFDCIVVQPIIQPSGMFSDGGEAEIYFSDDDRRLMVYMKSNIQGFPGALELYLKDYQPGVPLNADSRAEAAQAREARVQAAADVGRQ